MAKKKEKEFADTLYVKIEQMDTPYYVADEDITTLVNMGEKTKIATYKLVQITLAEGTVKFSKE